MKKSNLLIVFLTILSLSSCQTERRQEMVASFSSPYWIPLPSEEGRVKVKTSDFVTPFNTSISASLYYYEGDFSKEQLEEIQSSFVFEMEKAHALSDRHYSYTLDGKDIVNVKTINDSYGKDMAIKVDDYLFDLLKASYSFTLASDSKFNMFLGYVNDIYEDKLNAIKSLDGERYISALDRVMTSVSNLRFSSFDSYQKGKIEELSRNLPTSQSSLKDILTFDEKEKSVTFHSKFDEKGNLIPLSISLGGNAKGFFTQYFCDLLSERYKDSCFIMNSGTSSIKTTALRPDKKSWNVRYINPAYQECLDKDKTSLNQYELILSVKDSFNISTSGYYENYFYELVDKKIQRRSHILDPKTGYSNSYFDQASVLLEDTGLADMYTTALMNTSSIEEATSLFAKLNDIYHQENASLILCVKEKDDNPYSYSLSSYSPLNEDGYPICSLKDGSFYQGDYTNLSYSDISSIETAFKDSFQETIYVSKDIYSSCKIEENENSISVLKELNI